MTTRLYPRILRPVAISLWNEIEAQPIEQLTALSSARHDRAVYAAVGGSRVEKEELSEIRVAAVELVRELGFPNASNLASRRTFDEQLARLLHKTLDINPGEAARESVWSFFGLVLFPDLARWRFPGGVKGARKERFVGGVRNTFQRLWWRAHVLFDPDHTDPYHYVASLSEDAFVAIMERPGLSSDSKIARSLAEAIEELDVRLSDRSYEFRQEVWRDAIKRLRQRLVVVNLGALDYADLKEVVRGFFLDSSSTLT